MLASHRGLTIRIPGQELSLKSDKPLKEKNEDNSLKSKPEVKFDNKENNTKSSIKSSNSNRLNIYKDPDSVCHYCNVDTSVPKHKTVKQCDASTLINSTVSDLNDLLCSEKQSENYWEELAEQRRVALVESLEENKELCDLVEKLNADIERLSAISERAKEFVDFYQKCVPSTEATSTSTE